MPCNLKFKTFILFNLKIKFSILFNKLRSDIIECPYLALCNGYWALSTCNTHYNI